MADHHNEDPFVLREYYSKIYSLLEFVELTIKKILIIINKK